MAKVTLATTQANAAATAVKDGLDSGAGDGKMDIYDGLMPNSSDDAITTQVLLGTLTLQKPCGTVANGVLTFVKPDPCLAAVAAGIARFARFTNSAGVAVVDGDISKAGGGGSITLLTTVIAINGPIEVDSIYLAFK